MINQIIILLFNERIILIINNNKTMVTFYSRAIGALTSKGIYITDLDYDDIFINEDIFDIAYNSA